MAQALREVTDQDVKCLLSVMSLYCERLQALTPNDWVVFEIPEEVKAGELPRHIVTHLFRHVSAQRLNRRIVFQKSHPFPPLCTV